MTNWKIVELERRLPSGLITNVHWSAELVDEGFKAYTYGSLVLPAKDPSDSTFVEFEDITKEQAIEWLKEAMGDEQVTNLEKSLSSQIEAQKNPKSASGLPW